MFPKLFNATCNCVSHLTI
uniref:Uncharacterized protein n=1 Tax=Anguilla anguilla TaxID=7936 RepID=A0A0E9QHY7_ANGAN